MHSPSIQAVIKRINRRYAAENVVLKKCPTSSPWYHDLGDYYQVDKYHNVTIGKHLDLEKLDHEGAEYE